MQWIQSLVTCSNDCHLEILSEVPGCFLLVKPDTCPILVTIQCQQYWYQLSCQQYNTIEKLHTIILNIQHIYNDMPKITRYWWPSRYCDIYRYTLMITIALCIIFWHWKTCLYFQVHIDIYSSVLLFKLIIKVSSL